MSPGAYILQRPFLRGLFLEGLILGGAYLRREIDWASLIFGGKFTVFALFYFVFEGNFPSTSPRGAYIWRGLYMEGLIFGILRYSLNCHVLKKFCVKELLQLIMESQHN